VQTECPIVYEDAQLLVIAKPAGVLSHPNPGQPAEATAFLGRYDAEKRCFNHHGQPLWLLHRLDQDTSGILLAARTAQAAERCRATFETGRVEKHYLAVVRGRLHGAGSWEDYLETRQERGRVRSGVVKGRRPPNALLHFKPLGYEEEQRLSLLGIQLITGRTHQIRVQAASRQHPLAGDDVYGDFTLNRRLRQQVGLRRLALHAHQLILPHPSSGQRLHLEAPRPEDLGAAFPHLLKP
jgi:RluA family pseudouridine synthase